MFISSSRIQRAQVIIVCTSLTSIHVLCCANNRNGRHVQLACVSREEKKGGGEGIRYVLVRSRYVCLSLVLEVIFGTMLALSFKMGAKGAMDYEEVKGVQGRQWRVVAIYYSSCCLPSCENDVRKDKCCQHRHKHVFGFCALITPHERSPIRPTQTHSLVI